MTTLKHLGVALAMSMVADAALACSTCGCGDYTITLMGAEKPFGGRLRAALDYSMRSEVHGAAGTLDWQDIDEQRANLGLSYSFSTGLTLAAQVPFVRKRVHDGDLGEIKSEGLGDADLLLRWVAFRPNPRHLAGLRAGLRLPTSEEVEDQDGHVIDIDAQPDAGATAPSLGAWYGYYRFPVFVSASTYYVRYGKGRQGFEPGNAIVGSVAGQYAIGQQLALQLGLDARHTQENRFSGREDPNSGGLLVMGFVGGAVRFGPDFLIHAGVQLPLADNLNGVQEEEVGYRAGVAYDFGTSD